MALEDYDEHDYFNVRVLAERPKSYRVALVRDGFICWVPKSLCELKDVAGERIVKVLEVAHWWAEKEGLNE